MPNNLVRSDLRRVARNNATAVMSNEEYPLIALTESSRVYVTETSERNGPEVRRNLIQRLRLPRPKLRSGWRKLRRSLQSVNCFGRNEEVLVDEIPRHKSIDIGVGLARRVSLFIFTRKSVCAHPYHPFTPSQTTRKIFFLHDDKKNPNNSR